MENGIRITAYDPVFADNVRALDEQMYREILYHGDVRTESVMLALSGMAFCGAGYLLAAPGDRLHLVFKTDIRTETGIDAAEALIDTLIGQFTKLRKKNPALKLCVWCKESEKAYREFLEYFGFRKEAGMLTMVQSLQALEQTETRRTVQASPFEIRMLELTDPSEMREYMRVNAEGFGIPDSEKEMLFRVKHCGAELYGAGNGTELYAAVTTWPVTEARAATENVFCAAKHRRQGITSALLLYVHGVLLEKGYKEAVLNVYDDDIPAIRMYEKLGYRTEEKLAELRL